MSLVPFEDPSEYEESISELREPAAREATQRFHLAHPELLATVRSLDIGSIYNFAEAYSAELRAEIATLNEAWKEDLKQWAEEQRESRASLLQARIILDDPERKVEYGTPEYFLIQRLRTALASTSAPEGT